MMSAVPAYSSLPGAPNTLYLDFDGDFQPYWNRTDSGQMYLNVVSGEYNKDSVAGFNQTELNDIREIWQGVAEDYSPFNVNVTTVEPAASAFTTNQAMRVVIAGLQSAMLLDPHFVGNAFLPYTFLAGNRFITNNHGSTLADNSGYSALNSYTNAEPNVVFVFAAYTNTWASKDTEGHTRNYNQLIVNTASHEAGHTFGLIHHTGKDAAGNASDYDVGNFLTTPIMGYNPSADRTIWSQTSYQDTVQKLTTALGARPDGVSNSYASAKNLTFFPIAYDYVKQFDFASASGIIGTTSDTDWFRLSTAGGSFQFEADPVTHGNLDVKLQLYQRLYYPGYGFALSLVASSDPAVPSNQPFSGLNATLSRSLSQGEYYVVVSSHGSYGDLGQYSLFVTRNAPTYTAPQVPILVQGPIPTAPDPGPKYINPSIVQLVGTHGGGAGQVAGPTPAARTTTDLAADRRTPTKFSVSKMAKEQATDMVFADWS